MGVLKQNQDFIFKQVKGESVLLNAKTGDYFGLNEVGTDFFKLVDGEKNMDEITEELLNLYEVEKDTLQRDLEELTGKMLEKGILVKV